MRKSKKTTRQMTTKNRLTIRRQRDMPRANIESPLRPDCCHRQVSKSRPSNRTGLLPLLVFCLGCCLSFQAASNIPLADEWLESADHVKRSDYSNFLELLEKLDTHRQDLSQSQLDYLSYLHAWQLTYDG